MKRIKLRWSLPIGNNHNGLVLWLCAERYLFNKNMLISYVIQELIKFFLWWHIYQLAYRTFIFTVIRFYVINDKELRNISHKHTQTALLFAYRRCSRIAAYKTHSCISVHRKWSCIRGRRDVKIYISLYNVKRCISLRDSKLYISPLNVKLYQEPTLRTALYQPTELEAVYQPMGLEAV